MEPEFSLSMLAEMRRGLKALNSVFGNKIAILAGDFLLARASVSLAALRDSEVIQLLSQVIEDLVTGEILQVCTSMCCRPALLAGPSGHITGHQDGDLLSTNHA